MAVADRHIHQLRLHGPSAAVIQRGATLLEDALRTASMPSIPGRILLIRSLSLGSIALEGSSASIALLIEQKMFEVSRHAIHISTPAALHANAVYYHDEAEAFLLLAQRIANGQPLTAWFWSRIMPDLKSDQSATYVLPRLFEAIIQKLEHANTDERAAVLHWLAALNTKKLLDPILRPLTPTDGLQLLRLFQWEQTLPLPPTSELSARFSDLPARLIRKLAIWQPLLSTWIQNWGPTDTRTHWLVQVVLEQTSTLPPQLMAHRTQQVIQWAQTVVDRSTSNPVNAAAPTQPPSDETRLPELAPTGRPSSADDNIRPGTAYATALGGLFYCIKIISYLGIGDLLAEQPEWVEQQFTAHVFRALAIQYTLPLSDPALAILTADLGALPFPVQAYAVPTDWNDLIVEPSHIVTNGVWSARYDADGLPLAVWSGAAPSDVVSGIAETLYDENLSVPTPPMIWAQAIERWCALFLYMPLSTLIERSAQVVTTRTHLDIVFDHAQVDVAVRRAGLDFDPGWIDWLGKVVKFYYEYSL